MDDPPVLGPDERPSPQQLGQLARQLLREMAEHDSGLAKRLRNEGIDPEDWRARG
jgi:hypothetical protein